MFSEDIDMSTRIRLSKFSIGLYTEVPVWHKRRIDWRRFWRQVHIFGMSRITLKMLYPDSLKLVHTLPALAVIGFVVLVLLGIFVSPWFFAPLLAYFIAIFVCALIATKSLKIAVYAIPAAAIQLGGYGTGFIRAYYTKIIMGKGRNVAQEIAMRKGK
jgi:GT2 family glycosyltransferase